ncbi:PREDICTED: transmembrane protein 183B isoform X2 [Nicrophorus vespilloides]|uniref:Transmembrane protein 183B isoform X2 n=1 Tax=Nicrophorus vespilloides TaxID=110193 RepID=A0ABM1NFL7_NICVS|nr:PREDICTED: transmembrane protein 183B isoform X2 [Nicrophorus vespilloides]
MGEEATAIVGDVTINDFANSNVCPRKPKKCDVNGVIKLEPQSWDEYNENDYEYVEERSEDGSVSLVAKKKDKPREEAAICKTEGNEYPYDIWQLLSEYIRPEDVGRFSGICKACYSVTNTARFWQLMYKKNYVNKHIPEHLRPRNVSRMYGIRTLVIKSLFFMYPPYVERCKVDTYKDNMDVLLKRQCVETCVELYKGKWYYKFKLQRMKEIRRQCSGLDLIEMLEDISANNEDDCMLLKIVSLDHFLIPPLEGMYLTSIRSKLGQDMSHYNLHLRFSTTSCHAHRPVDGGDSIHVYIDPVYHIEILDWWHSRYPHIYNMKLSLNQE